jgi:adenosine deaminase
MRNFSAAKTCELHVHVAGCLTEVDVVELAKDVYRDVDWTLFVDAYEATFNVRPNPVTLIGDVLADKPGGLTRLREHFLFTDADEGDFMRFKARFSLAYSVVDHLGKVNRAGDVIRRCLAHHRKEGVDFVEYRSSGGEGSWEGFHDFHYGQIKELMTASEDGMTARYMISLRRSDAMEDYEWVLRLMDDHPETVSTIVGVDFCNVEEGFPPGNLRSFFGRIARDNEQRPERPLDVVYHVGESFFDKSLESAVRWCHEAAGLGAKRLGHAIALGLDPAAAIVRRPDAHTTELVSERLNQIAYDLEHSAKMSSYGVDVDGKALVDEREALQKLSPDETVHRAYDEERLEDIRGRQGFVLDCLTEMGTVIESCPTSNLRIGGVPDPADHPVHRFLDSDVNLAICADDPGIFATSLADEVDWVRTHSGWETDDLEKRLGDPRRFQLGS